ncbi:hypothetical protein GGI24_007150, partial [Coemansia furcata]
MAFDLMPSVEVQSSPKQRLSGDRSSTAPDGSVASGSDADEKKIHTRETAARNLTPDTSDTDKAKAKVKVILVKYKP